MGYDFLIHVKYTTVMNITYTAMMYGMFIPMIFPLAAIAIYNQKLCERILVATYYKLPPKLGDKMTRDVLHLMKYAPFFLLFNTFWIMDNQQFFNNKWIYKMTSW